MNDLTEREVAIFVAARRLPAGERAAYLDGACVGDSALRRRLDELLGVDETAGEFLERPAQGQLNLATVPGMAGRPIPPAEKPGDRIGPYKLLRQIGEGGCGVVYGAEQETPLRRQVALKVIKLGMDIQQVIARFEAERQALALMDHPNIAKVLDAGATGTGRPYFVMELVPGARVNEFCDRNFLTTRQRLDLFIQVCEAIQHAHQKGIIHRDIKPSNILVTMDGEVPVPKVIDFGIAKATQGPLTDQTLFTALGQFMGTPAYMSPEQAGLTGLDVDTRSDIYSLGVLLYELLAGSTPFDTKEMAVSGVDALCRTIREQEPVRPSTRLASLKGEALTATAQCRSVEAPKLIHQLKGDLDWIVMKCLEKDRTRRYETANGLAADIKRHMNNEPVVARRPSAAYKFQKAWQRNKLAFTMAAVMAVTLVAGITFSGWQAIEAGRARNAEKDQRLAAQAERDKAQAARRKAEEAREAEREARLAADADKLAADHFVYVANMNLAQQAWDQDNFGRLRQLLADTRDSPFRGFEWYYWQRQTHLALETLQGHLHYVTSSAFSPDGRWIVTGSDDGLAKLWDVAGGRELQTFSGHEGPIMSVRFSPDGRRLLSGSSDMTARVWDAATGRELLRLHAGKDGMLSAAFSPDGRRIVTGSSDMTARIWDAAGGKELLTLAGHSNEVNSVAYSPDGRRIATGSADATAKVWDASSGEELWTIRGHGGPITSVDFSPDGLRLVTGSADTTAREWDVVGGGELRKLAGHGDRIDSVAFSPDGHRIVTGSWDQTCKVWDADSGAELFSLRGHDGRVDSAAWSPDGRKIVTGSWDQTAKLWDATGSRELLVLGGKSGDFISMAFSRDGQQILTGGADGIARLWDVVGGGQLRTFSGHGDAISSVAFAPDGQRFVTGSFDGTTRVWETAGGRLIHTLKSRTGPIRSVVFSPDGRRIATGGDNGAEVWDAADGRELLRFKGHADRVMSVAFSPDGQQIVSGSWDRTARVWDPVSGREFFTLTGHNNTVRTVAFSPDGRRIVTGSADGTAKVWDAANGRELLTFKGHSGEIRDVAFSPDGRRIVTGGADKTAKVWDPDNGRELLTLKGHTNWIFSVAFSPDGRRIAAGSMDSVARIWEAADPGEVAAWQEAELAAANTLAGRQRERAVAEEHLQMVRSRDSIKQWLILAPIGLAPGQSGVEGLDIEQVQEEAQLRPRAGEAVSVAGKAMRWVPVATEDYLTDLNEILGQVTEHCVAYAVCYLESESEQRGLQMLVGSDDEAKVYLNGREIYKSLDTRTCRPDQDRVPNVTLHAGLNVLVLKVVNEEGGWGGTLRLVDGQGNTPQGIKVTLDPEAKTHP